MRVWILFSFVLAGCGSGELPSSGVVVQLQMPASLSRTEKRREVFGQHASRLEMEFTAKSGLQKAFNYPANVWDKIAVGDIAFPASKQDSLKVVVRIWDRMKDGKARATAALSGHASLKASDMAASGPTTMNVRLSLQVPVAEYD